VRYAQQLAFEFGASMHLVHVCELPSMMAASNEGDVIAYTEFSQRLGEEAALALNKMAARLLGTRTTTEVLFGAPAAAIIEAASTNEADLIVMGTHGHRAVMHLVLGSVAERVVRGAPCPVLTIREKVAAHVATRQIKEMHMPRAVLMAMVFALLLFPAAALAQTPEVVTNKQTNTGGEVFRTYCASCHGTSARGDGPLASSMVRKPANLSEIAKRNGGVFPTELVFRTIDGRQPIKGHGGADMPAWGDVFSKSREAGDTERVKAVIQSLVEFLESIQLRPAHDQ
jgi:nucleotide-binding universal stress UspA family protein